MKTKLFFYLLFSAFFAKAQYVTIPDSNFRKAIKQAYPQCFQNELLDTICVADKNGLLIIPLNNGAAYVQVILILSGKNISSLEGIQYFKALQTLNVSNNKLTKLPKINSPIREIYVDKNLLTSLEDLPSSITILSCVKNKITKIANLPSSITQLKCDSNKIDFIENLPSLLSYFTCQVNPLSCLPYLPLSIEFLQTDVACLPNIPSLGKMSTKPPLCNSTNGCPIITTIEEDEKEVNTIISYPNPVENGRLFISNAQGLNFKINNTQGQLIMNGTLDETGLDVSQLNQGMYRLEIGANENKKVEKIVIK